LLPELKKLVDVQELDKAIQEITQALEKLPEDLKAGATALEELQGEHAARLQELENLQSQRRETETEMADMEAGIKKSRQRLLEIKNNIEYKAMLKEIAFKEDQRDQKETRTLQLMEQIEAQKQAIAAQDQMVKEQQAILAQQKLDLEAQMEILKQELSTLEDQRRKARKGIPAQLLKRYEFIRQRRNGTAIAPVSEGVCHGCHMNILPQQFIDLQKGLEILQCPHCQRILYWLGEGADEEEPSRQKVS
jgi:predicted  nucleic acid-binding Zn-ribbon protein